MNRASLPAPGIAPKDAPVVSWRAVGVSVAGASHLRLGLPCQDAQGFAVHPSGALLVALADGAGSAERSELGAQAAVEAALAAMRAALDVGLPSGCEGWETLLREVFAAARAEVLRLAGEDAALDGADGDEAEAPFNPRAYACTLTCAIAAGDWLAVGQVGDGAVVAVDQEDGLFAVTRPQRGEYANETHFLVQEDALDRLAVEVVEQPARGLAVMSDGLIRLALKLPSQEPHGPFFQPLFRFAESIQDPAEASAQLAAFLDSERVNARTDDDKSLVLAVRVRDSAGEEATSLEVEGE